jgi:hypothetical protein
MISKETAVKIWNCHNEIESARQIICDIADLLAKDKEKHPPTLYNAFGERVGLQLGVPSGNDSQRIFGVNTELSIKIIENHIEEKEHRLKELMDIARIELTVI